MNTYDDGHFFSIDRLVEFGLGMSVANSLVRSMNSAIENMRIPGADNLMREQPLERVYYAVLDGKQAGPFSETELARLINDKKVDKNTYIWRTGMREWKMAQDVSDVLRLVALAPPPFQASGKEEVNEG